MVIVGAGIAGLATAIALKRVGVKALVLEKSEGLRAIGAAIGLHQNAWLALEALGVALKLTTSIPPLRKYCTFAPFLYHEFPFTISDNNYVFLCHFKFLHEICRLPLKTLCSLLFAHTLTYGSIHVSPFKYFILF